MNSAATLPLPSSAATEQPAPQVDGYLARYALPAGTTCPVCDSAPAYLTSRNLCPSETRKGV